MLQLIGLLITYFLLVMQLSDDYGVRESATTSNSTIAIWCWRCVCYYGNEKQARNARCESIIFDVNDAILNNA